ncbi:MAG: carbohydrate binding family 9 domain-containing protein, partial [Thermoanaerobaculia bacterium]|nr:carbohydrate binding family 9 domain-containing protein [Thermoanaerobaculia bacterium]
MRMLRAVVPLLLSIPPVMAQTPVPTPSPTPTAQVQAVRTYRARRAAGTIQVDGVLDETAWQQADRMELPVETFPGDNVTAPVKTEGFILFDDKYLYVGIRAQDPAPHKIRAHLSDRDKAFSDDFVGVVLDTFNDERRGFEFFVNPLGVQMDLFQNDVGGGEDSTWDAIWASAGRITAEGYVVEMAIPFSSLRFRRAAGEQTWGVDMLRIYPRSQRYRVGLQALSRNRNCYVCQFSKITGFEGITPGRNLEFDPTLTGQRTDQREDFPDGPLEGGDLDIEPGLTARWGITPNLTLNAALNPDFSQVEADVGQLDINTQFTLFFPEKRPFFLEGADFFQTPIQAVYTRTVADPDWGTKLTGKEGKSAIGVFIARDDLTNLIIPGSQGSSLTSFRDNNHAGVFRYRYDVGKNSTVGALYTGRDAQDYANHVTGADAFIRVTPRDQVRLQALASRTRYPGFIVSDFNQPDGTFTDHAYRFDYQHSTRNWFWFAEYEDIGEDFRADSGFLPQVNYRRPEAGLERIWWGPKGAWYSRIFLGGNWDRTEEQGGQLLEEEFEGYVGVGGPLQSFFFFGGGTRDRFYNGVDFEEQFGSAYIEIRPVGDL